MGRLKHLTLPKAFGTRWSLVRAQVGPLKGKQNASPFLIYKLFDLAFTYILYSKTLDRFYTGACHLDELEGRIEKHNTAVYGTHRFTARANDWELFLSFKCVDYSHSVRLERKIKSMKSSRYIGNLKKYPELRDKILKETQSN